MNDISKERQSFWNSRASLGLSAGTNDFVAKRMEMEAIFKYIHDGMSILDFGCGNGVTAINIARQKKVDIVGIDYAEAMIKSALESVKNIELMGPIKFLVADHLSLAGLNMKFDLAYTERCLINISDWQEQQKVIKDIIGCLTVGGLYLMCESSMNGLNEINRLRTLMGLEPIAQPWHNRYLADEEVSQLRISGARLIDINKFSSSYYFLSRVINAALSRDAQREPNYDDPINMMALNLPAISDCAQVKIWVWKKEND